MFNGLNHITPSLDCFFFFVVAAADDDDDGIYILFDNQRIKTSFFSLFIIFCWRWTFFFYFRKENQNEFLFWQVFKKLKRHLFALDQTL